VSNSNEVIIIIIVSTYMHWYGYVCLDGYMYN